jgi:signal transduction histidine kinase
VRHAARGTGAGEVRSILYLLAVGLFFVAAVFAIEILETHKSAGVVHKVTRGLREIEAGRWGTRVALRRHDNFKEMEEAFNAATQALRDVLDQDLRGLQWIEGQVRLTAREIESGNREGVLVLLRQVAGELQLLRERKRNFMEAATGVPSARKVSKV